MAGSEEKSRPFRLAGPLGFLRWPERLLAAYSVVASVSLAIGTAKGISGCASQLAGNAAIFIGLALLMLLSRDSRNQILLFLRLAYAPLLFLYFYRQTSVIWPVLYDSPFDSLVAGIEQTIFRSQPAFLFTQHCPWSWLSEIFTLAYFAYYCFTPVLILTVFFTRGYEVAERVVIGTAACFFSCYAFFWLFPVVGPFYWLPPHAGPVLERGFLFNHVLWFFTSRAEVPTGAFPSSHIAVAVLQTLYARHLAPRLFWYMLVITILMAPAVVYLRAHYVVDIFAGAIVGLLFVKFLPGRIYLR